MVAAVSALLGQFFALSHEVAVRHVRCAEHGELTHVAIAPNASDARAPEVTSFRAGETAPAGGHDHCSTALTLQTGVSSPVLRSAVQAALPPAVAWRESAAPPRERAFLLASAPKTSPPST